ncbi:hypothetical protein ACEQ8H_003240 [Pleosporales sp. CAS-2024a]
MARQHPSEDRFIPYGRGGAGNMRRQSTIRDSWFEAHAPNSNPNSTSPPSDPDEQFAASKSRPRRRSSISMWSTSTVGNEYRSVWKKWFSRRKDSVAQEEDKIEE